MPDEIYSLHDLADHTGIEARTIRSYIERGLLPGPDTLGRNASYSRSHLDRLRVVALVRDARRDLTLDQIRALIQQLSPRQIEDISAGRLRVEPLLPPDPGEAAASALAYLQSIQPTPHKARRAGGRASPEPPLAQLLEGLRMLTANQKVASSARSEAWHRIEVTPDIELSVRGAFSPEQLALLNQIGDHLRHLMMKGVSR